MNLILRRMAVRIVAVMFGALGIAQPVLESLGMKDVETLPAWAELVVMLVSGLMLGYAQKAKWLGDLNLLDVPPHIRDSISTLPPPPIAAAKGDPDADP